MSLSDILFKNNGLSNDEYDAYLMGNIWDHLKFSEVASKIKETSIILAKDKLNSKRPSESLKKLIGTAEYFGFIERLMIYNIYPNVNESKFSNFVLDLYYPI